MSDFCKKKVRTRFAPSPSGYLHLGNLRTAVFSYICAKENDGDFVLRIEDTDKSRTSEEYLNEIYKILEWVDIKPDEGPIQGGKHSSYFQSERSFIYKNYLNKLIENNFAYRCFKTPEELEEIKKKQILQKMPPRYERDKCLISKIDEEIFLKEGKPFIWRLKIPEGKTQISDKVRGKIEYDLSNFSDSPLTRADGSFTFLFSNFVDDVEMKISYVIRGEEHISNSAIQSVLYEIFKIEKPDFYHLPLIVDSNGKKLSKRNFGFSVRDFKNENYLPEAILNYLIIIGSSFKEEIFSIQEAINNKIFSSLKSSGSICYDLKKLQWVNKQWIKKISLENFKEKISNLCFEKYGAEANKILENSFLLNGIKNESSSLNESIEMIGFFLKKNSFYLDKENEIEKKIVEIIKDWLSLEIKSYKNFLLKIEDLSKKEFLDKKELFKLTRKIITGKPEGISLSLIFNEESFVYLALKI